jgi:predicted DCC family thiol-disulfide oxidoreductase YuxK
MSTHDVEVFHDGDCPLCMREIRMLQRRDTRGRIRFTDIAAPGFDPAAYGTDRATLMARIHGRLPDGTWIEGVEVFRRLYAAIGLGWLVGVTRLPGVAQVTELGYRLFARNRLRLTGRCAADGSCPLPDHGHSAHAD